MNRHTKGAATAAAALTLGLLLSACTGDATEPTDTSTDTAADATQAPEDDAAAHNEADTEFTQMMIVHHEGALEMASLTAERAETEDVRALSQRIVDAQQPEIDLMSGWLTAWDEEQPAAADHGAMDHEGMQMDGMDHDEAMAELRELDGVELDRRFLELMIDHHRGAVVMSEEVRGAGEHPEVRSLAGTIIDDQTREITEMEGLLRDLD